MYKSREVAFDGVGVKNNESFTYCEAEYPAECIVTNPKILHLDSSTFTVETTPYGRGSVWLTGNEVSRVTEFHNENLAYLFTTSHINHGVLEGNFAIVKHRNRAFLVDVASEAYRTIVNNSRRFKARLATGKTYKVSFSKSFKCENIFFNGVSSVDFGRSQQYLQNEEKLRDYFESLYEGEKVLTYIGRASGRVVALLASDGGNPGYSYRSYLKKVTVDNRLNLKTYENWMENDTTVFYDRENDIYIHGPRRIFSLESEVKGSIAISPVNASLDILSKIIGMAERYGFSQSAEDKDIFFKSFCDCIAALWTIVPIPSKMENSKKLLSEQTLLDIMSETMHESIQKFNLDIAADEN